MRVFNGILNDNGLESKIILYLDPCKITPYVTDYYINNNRYEAKIDDNEYTLIDTVYEYKIKKYHDEILIMGKEKLNFWYICFPCLYRPKFFLLTDKEEV